MRGLKAAALGCLLFGCAAIHPGSPPPWVLPDPGLAPFQGQLLQSVRVGKDGHDLEFLAVLAHVGDTVTLVALGPLGQRLLTLTWGPQGVKKELAPAVAAQLAAGHFDPESALRDMVLATWPRASIEAALGAGPWSLRQDAQGRRELWCQGRRRVAVHDTPEGTLIEHEPEAYRVSVKTLPTEGQGDD